MTDKAYKANTNGLWVSRAVPSFSKPKPASKEEGTALETRKSFRSCAMSSQVQKHMWWKDQLCYFDMPSLVASLTPLTIHPWNSNKGMKGARVVWVLRAQFTGDHFKIFGKEVFMCTVE